MGFLRRLLPDRSAEKKYVRAGANFGDVVSYSYMGESVGFKRLLNKWAGWEKEYARRGFRTVSLDRFIDLGGYAKPLDDVLGQKREDGEEPIFHAQLYQEQPAVTANPPVDLELIVTKGVQEGTYHLPSTEAN